MRTTKKGKKFLVNKGIPRKRKFKVISLEEAKVLDEERRKVHNAKFDSGQRAIIRANNMGELDFEDEEEKQNDLWLKGATRSIDAFDELENTESQFGTIPMHPSRPPQRKLLTYNEKKLLRMKKKKVHKK